MKKRLQLLIALLQEEKFLQNFHHWGLSKACRPGLPAGT
jgi:hypothetical protein